MKRYKSIAEVFGIVDDELLSPEEEQLLLAAIKEKGVECEEMDKLIHANMRFIVSLANQYKHKGVDLMDLVWTTQNAFADAALQYEPTAETKFLKFAIQLSRHSLSKI